MNALCIVKPGQPIGYTGNETPDDEADESRLDADSAEKLAEAFVMRTPSALSQVLDDLCQADRRPAPIGALCTPELDSMLRTTPQLLAVLFQGEDRWAIRALHELRERVHVALMPVIAERAQELLAADEAAHKRLALDDADEVAA